MKYRAVTQEEVDCLKKMLRDFYEYHKTTGFPDWSNSYVAYLPVVSIALLRSQRRIEKLTWVLIALTFVLFVLTVVSVFSG